MDSQYHSLLFYTEIRWLSKGKILTKLFELRDDFKIFLSGQNILKLVNFFELLYDEHWLMKLAYLADIFSKFNEVTKSLQGK